MTFEYLDDPLMRQVQDVATELGFLDQGQVAGLTAGISHVFVAANTEGNTPYVRLTTLTTKMNCTPALTSGEVPLARWLENAINMAAGRPQEMVFRKALEEIKRAWQERRTCCHLLEVGGDFGPPPRDNPEYRGALMHTAWLPIQFLEDGQRAGESVALVCVPRFEQGQMSGTEVMGTGWLIGPGLLITAYYVVNARADDQGLAAQDDFAYQALSAQVTFGYDGEGQPGTVVSVTGLVEQNHELDYVILRLEDAPDAPPLRLAGDAPVAGRDSSPPPNLIIHPWGQPKMFALRSSSTTVVTQRTPDLQDPADTDKGAAGAPVFDNDWRVIAIHRATTQEVTRAVPQGVPATWANNGTHIAAILADLKRRSDGVWRSILDGQAVPLRARMCSPGGPSTWRLPESSDALRELIQSIARSYQANDDSWVWDRRLLLSELDGVHQQLEAIGAWLASTELSTPGLSDALTRYHAGKDRLVQRLGALDKRSALATERSLWCWEFEQACESLLDLIRSIQEQLDSLGPGDHPVGQG